MRIVFMGTPDFSVGTLEALIEAGHEIALVVTQPDKQQGRGKAFKAPPVKECALAHGLAVYQPKRVREPECVAYLKSFAPDMIVVVAFGQILSREILELPKYCCVNVHASLLPKYRGAAPIQWAVIQGERVTGVTTMRMDEGIDTGDMIDTIEVPLAEDETGGSLFDKLARAGAELCVETLASIEAGTAVYTPQDHGAATHTGMIKKQLGQMDFSKRAMELERLVRGLNPWPSAYTFCKGKALKIWKSRVVEEAAQPEHILPKNWETGAVHLAGKNRLLVKCKEGWLELLEVQLEGKKRMDVASFLRGYPLEDGDCLGV